jgi:hypothetical protein
VYLPSFFKIEFIVFIAISCGTNIGFYRLKETLGLFLRAKKSLVGICNIMGGVSVLSDFLNN